MLVTLFGISIQVSELQSSKAFLSILVTEEGMLMEVRELQMKNMYLIVIQIIAI